MRILFVGMANSFHLARWINQLDDQGWDLHVFPLDSDHGLDPDLKNVTVHDALYGRPFGSDESVRAVDDFWPFLRDGYPFSRGLWMARHLERKVYPKRANRAWRLAYTIDRLKPDIIHSMTICPAGDLVMEARQYLDLKKFPKWIVSSWGSDIYLYPRLKEYAEKSRAVLSHCDYFICDCRRDVETARQYGFRGEFLGQLPGAGGFRVEQARKLPRTDPTSARKIILMKGVQSFSGRALFGIRALELCADALRDYRVVIYYNTPTVAEALTILSEKTGIQPVVLPRVPYDELLQLFGSARLSIGLGISDGLPLSILEAMVMGAFPIQSDTSCANEWLKDDENCLFVHPEDPEQIAAAIRRALADDRLVDEAAIQNGRLMQQHFDESVIKPQVVAHYQKVANDPRDA